MRSAHRRHPTLVDTVFPSLGFTNEKASQGMPQLCDHLTRTKLSHERAAYTCTAYPADAGSHRGSGLQSVVVVHDAPADMGPQHSRVRQVIEVASDGVAVDNRDIGVVARCQRA